MILHSAMDALDMDALGVHPCTRASAGEQQCQRENVKTILPLSSSLQFHTDVKGPAIIVKASLAQGFSPGDK